LARRKNFRCCHRINAADEMSFASNKMLFEANIKFLPLLKKYFGKQHFFCGGQHLFRGFSCEKMA
jgi:hypothetical protein